MAIPIMLGSVIEHAIGLIDTSLLSSLSKEELGGAGLGVHSYFFVFMICFGLTSGIQILFSRHFGKLDYLKIGKVFVQSSWMILLFSIFAFLILFVFSDSILTPVIKEVKIRQNMNSYLNYRSIGILFTALCALFNALFISTNKTIVLSISSIFILVSNWILDIALIHGNWGFPEMKVAGAALASAISSGIGLLVLIISSLLLGYHKKFEIYSFSLPIKKKMLEILKIGLPLMVQFFVAFLGWTFFFFVIEKMGPMELSVSVLLRSLYIVLLLPIIALGNTTNTLTSNLISQGKFLEIDLLIKNVLKVSIPIGLFLTTICWVFPKQILQLLTDETYLIEASYDSFLVVSSSIIIFSVSCIYFNVIIGSGDTKKSLLIEIMTILIYIIPVYLFALVFEFPLPIVWSTEHIYFIIFGLFSYYIVKKRKFKLPESLS